MNTGLICHNISPCGLGAPPHSGSTKPTPDVQLTSHLKIVSWEPSAALFRTLRRVSGYVEQKLHVNPLEAHSICPQTCKPESRTRQNASLPEKLILRRSFAV